MTDLIDRQAVKDAFHAYMARRFDKDRCANAENCETCEGKCLWHEVVASVPAADAAPVVHGYNTGRARWFECSVCGYGFNDIFLLDESDDMLEPKYCGHCGAKMDGDRRC